MNIRILLLVLAPTSVFAQVSLQTFSQTTFFGISANGQYVVGESWTPLRTAVAWHSSTGLTSIGTSSGYTDSRAMSVSNTGVVVGYDRNSFTPTAWTWSSSEGKTFITSSGFYGWGISSDANTVIGYGASPNGTEAFRWSSSDGFSLLGDLPDGNFNSQVGGISNDGSVIAGQGLSGEGIEAIRWTSSTGIVSIGDLLGGSVMAQSYAISGDGTVIVGRSQSASGLEAFVWTEASGMTGLGTLPGDPQSEARDVSANGLTIGLSGNSMQNSFIYDSVYGMRLLGTGVQAYGISDDGTVIVGSFSNGDGFIATDPSGAWASPISAVPEPSNIALVFGAVSVLVFVLRDALPKV